MSYRKQAIEFSQRKCILKWWPGALSQPSWMKNSAIFIDQVYEVPSIFIQCSQNYNFINRNHTDCRVGIQLFFYHNFISPLNKKTTPASPEKLYDRGALLVRDGLPKTEFVRSSINKEDRPYMPIYHHGSRSWLVGPTYHHGSRIWVVGPTYHGSRIWVVGPTYHHGSRIFSSGTNLP